MHPITTLRLLAAGLAVLAASPAAMAGEAYFKTPSGNIHCAYFDYDSEPQVRCDIRDYTATTPPAPSDCDLEWGDAFAIAAGDGKGSLVCHGDTVMTPDARVLGYGKRFEGDGISCVSEQAGLTCANRKGHGFFLSRAKQKLF